MGEGFAAHQSSSYPYGPKLAGDHGSYFYPRSTAQGCGYAHRPCCCHTSTAKSSNVPRKGQLWCKACALAARIRPQLGHWSDVHWLGHTCQPNHLYVSACTRVPNHARIHGPPKKNTYPSLSSDATTTRPVFLVQNTTYLKAQQKQTGCKTGTPFIHNGST